MLYFKYKGKENNKVDRKEAISKLKFSEARIIKIKEKISKLTSSLEEKLLGSWTRSQKARFRKEYKTKLKMYKSIIQENKRIITQCKRVLKPKKQIQVNTIVPVNIDVELPIIKENLLKGIEGLKATDQETFIYNNIEYTIDHVDNSNKRTGTEIVFKPVKILSSSINLSSKEKTEDYFKPIACTLHKGYYVVKEDGFNNKVYTMSAEEEREKRKLYNNFYYRNRTKFKRLEGKELLTKTCKYCGKKFTTYSAKKCFCSTECSEASKIKPTYTRVCSVCGKEFNTTYASKVTCSKKCREKRRNILAHPNLYQTYTKKCEKCGKEFITNRKNGKYCSEKCRNEMRVEYYRKYYYSNLESK